LETPLFDPSLSGFFSAATRKLPVPFPPLDSILVPHIKPSFNPPLCTPKIASPLIRIFPRGALYPSQYNLLQPPHIVFDPDQKLTVTLTAMPFLVYTSSSFSRSPRSLFFPVVGANRPFPLFFHLLSERCHCRSFPRSPLFQVLLPWGEKRIAEPGAFFCPGLPCFSGGSFSPKSPLEAFSNLFPRWFYMLSSRECRRSAPLLGPFFLDRPEMRPPFTLVFLFLKLDSCIQVRCLAIRESFLTHCAFFFSGYFPTLGPTSSQVLPDYRPFSQLLTSNLYPPHAYLKTNQFQLGYSGPLQ